MVTLQGHEYQRQRRWGAVNSASDHHQEEPHLKDLAHTLTWLLWWGLWTLIKHCRGVILLGTLGRGVFISDVRETWVTLVQRTDCDGQTLSWPSMIPNSWKSHLCVIPPPECDQHLGLYSNPHDKAKMKGHHSHNYITLCKILSCWPACSSDSPCWCDDTEIMYSTC